MPGGRHQVKPKPLFGSLTQESENGDWVGGTLTGVMGKTYLSAYLWGTGKTLVEDSRLHESEDLRSIKKDSGNTDQTARESG